MKTILEFNFPEDIEEFKLCMSGKEYYFTLNRIKETIRHKLKYEEISLEVQEALQNIKDIVNEVDIE